MNRKEIYAQGYAISKPVNNDNRTFTFNDEEITVPSHHIMIENLDGFEVSDINRVREVAELYRDERV